MQTLTLAAFACLPILVLIVALARRTWYPTGDLAQAEMRMRSLPWHPPMVGAAGRIVDKAGRQGNHPGPLMFWVTWPIYALLGRSSWAFEAATAFVNLAWLATATWLVRRRATLAVAAWFAVVSLVLIGGFGLDALSQPWNPWVALLPFVVLVLTAWRALDGWRWAPVLAVAAASYAIQGHAGYAPVALPLVAVAAIAPVVIGRRLETWNRGRDGERPAGRNRPIVRAVVGVVLAVLVGLVAWSGPFVDAVAHHPSNLHKLFDNFASRSAAAQKAEPVLGVGSGARTMIRALSPVGAWVKGGIVVDGSVIPGLVLMVAWIGVVIALVRSPERRARHRNLLQLDAVLALALLFGFVAITRIFGEPYLYVFRWIVVLAALVVFTLGWGVAVIVPRRSNPDVRPVRTVRNRTAGAAIGLILLSVFTSVRVARQGIPYPYSWRQEREMAPTVAQALRSDRTYLIEWQDPVYLGGLGFGLMLDLERRGFHVGADAQYSAAVEPRRVLCPGHYDAVITVVTGPLAIDTWHAKPGVREIMGVGSAPGFDYDATFARLQRTLAAAGTTYDPARLEQVLSLVLLNPHAPKEANRLAAQLVSNGVPTEVFIQDPAPPAPPVDHTAVNEPCWK